jgi:hypothetical protein
MHNNRRASLPSLSVFIPVSPKQIRAIRFGSNGQGTVECEGDWSSVMATLSVADFGVITVLFGDMSQKYDVRWVALLCAVEQVGEKTKIVVAFLSELLMPVPLSELRQHAAATSIRLPPPITPFVCKSPRFHPHSGVTVPAPSTCADEAPD